MKKLTITLLVALATLGLTIPAMAASKKPPKASCWSITGNPNGSFEFAIKKGGKLKTGNGKTSFYLVQGTLTTTSGDDQSYPCSGSGHITTHGADHDFIAALHCWGLDSGVGYLNINLDTMSATVGLRWISSGLSQNYPLVERDCKEAAILP